MGGKRCLEPCGREEARRVEDQGVKRPIRGRRGSWAKVRTDWRLGEDAGRMAFQG